MRRAGAAGVAVVVVIGLAACGSSDDDDGESSGTQVSVATTSAPPGVEPVQVTPAPPPAGGGGGGEGTTTAPPEVGAVLLGTAVATVSGGEDPLGQSGDVERRDQECKGVGTLTGLEAGAPVAVRDVATGASVGAGIVEATTATQIKDSSDGSPPEWDCHFPFRVALSAHGNRRGGADRRAPRTSRHRRGRRTRTRRAQRCDDAQAVAPGGQPA